MTRPTYCSECEHAHPEGRKRHPRYWLCIKFPQLEGQGFVAPDVWVESEPYKRCSGINGGSCPMFERQKTLETKDI